MFDAYGEIVSLLDLTEWQLEGDQIVFETDADVTAYNRYIEQIQSIATLIESEYPDWLRQIH